MTEAPPSATDYRINLVGLAAMLATGAVLLPTAINANWIAVLLMVAASVPILALDLGVHRVHLRPTTGLDWSKGGPRDWDRITRRWGGAVAVVTLVGAVYFLAPEYQGRFYEHFYWLVRAFGPPFAVVGLGYLAWVDRYLVDPRDGYWQLGSLIAGRGRGETGVDKIPDLLRGWVIKGFFVPLMYTYAVKNVIELQEAFAADGEPLLRLYEGLWSLSFLVDVIFTTMGYLLTVRLFDTHLRSAEPTVGGWVVALVCYQPFWGLISHQFLWYEDGFTWRLRLAGVPAVKVAWGVAILLLCAMFSGSTVAFGCRFSNLTHRGIVTGGPYAWTRHPAYVSKCASYWLIAVPFVYTGSGYEILRDCVGLSGVCVVYWLRARTEERHLSRDPAYVRYALWMNDHSVFASLGRWFPILAYRAPTRPPSQPAEPDEL